MPSRSPFLAPAAVAYSIEETWLAVVIGAVGVYLATVAGDLLRRRPRRRGGRRPRRTGLDGARRDGRRRAERGRDPGLGTRADDRQPRPPGAPRARLLGNLLLGAAAVAWGLATLLVVPLIALEGIGPLEALGRSTALFRQRWGEQLAGTASIGTFFTILGVMPAALLIFVGTASGSTAVAIALLVVGVLIAVAAGILGSAARAVFAVALYRYASGSGATGPFTVHDLELAVVRKA